MRLLVTGHLGYIGAEMVPILLDEAIMPAPNDLPEDLRKLSKINAFALRTSHFDEDMDDLLDALIGNKKGRGSRWRRAPRPRRILPPS